MVQFYQDVYIYIYIYVCIFRLWWSLGGGVDGGFVYVMFRKQMFWEFVLLDVVEVFEDEFSLLCVEYY